MRDKSWGSRLDVHGVLAATTVNVIPITVAANLADQVVERLIGKLTIKGGFTLGAIITVTAGIIVVPSQMALSGIGLQPCLIDSGMQWLWTDAMFAHVPVGGILNEHEMIIESSARRRMEPSGEVLCLYAVNHSAVAVDYGLYVRYLVSS